ncbi:hypothetical protein ACFX19_046274 [Malus domestica]
MIPTQLIPLFVAGIWWLWNDRNQLVFGSQRLEFEVLIQRVKDYVKEYCEINLSRHRSAPLQAQSNVWRPLLDTRGGKKGVRAVIRDWNALKVGTEFAIDARWLPLIVESDSQNAIRLITQDDTCFAPEGNFVEEVRDLTVNHHLVLIAIPREANGAAYRAARYSLHEQGFDFWTDVGHPWLTEILNLESVVG